MNTMYRREKSNWIGSTGANDAGENYWRAQARKIFAKTNVEVVEIVHTGRKTDASCLRRGAKHSQPGVAVIIASTGGRWGRSRKDYLPVNH